MKLKYYGHACFTLRFADGTVLAIDPFDESVSYAPCDAVCDAALLSHDHFDHNHFCNNDNNHNDDNDDYYHHRGDHCDYCGNDYNYRDQHYSGATAKESDGFAGKSGSGHR